MDDSRWFAAMMIHLGVPGAGVLVYLSLLKSMWRRRIPDPPELPLFLLFVNYGGWLMVMLAGFFWEWSGMASLGVFYLLLAAPFVSIKIAVDLIPKRAVSAFHRWLFRAAIAYTSLVFALVLAVNVLFQDH